MISISLLWENIGENCRKTKKSVIHYGVKTKKNDVLWNLKIL